MEGDPRLTQREEDSAHPNASTASYRRSVPTRLTARAVGERGDAGVLVPEHLLDEASADIACFDATNDPDEWDEEPIDDDDDGDLHDDLDDDLDDELDDDVDDD